MYNYIKKLLREGLNPCEGIKYTDEIKSEVMKFNSDEELLRGGGISNDALDRAAFGFSESDITQLNPKQIKIRWINDLENVKSELRDKGLTVWEYANSVDLSEPVDVDLWDGTTEGFRTFTQGFYLQDGHHRYYAAKVLNKPLNVNLTIKINPINILGNGLGYDDYHRCLFKMIKSGI